MRDRYPFALKKTSNEKDPLTGFSTRSSFETGGSLDTPSTGDPLTQLRHTAAATPWHELRRGKTSLRRERGTMVVSGISWKSTWGQGKGRTGRSGRERRQVLAHAKDMKLCKDMVVVPQGNKGDPNVKYQVTFLGAKGQQTTIEVPSDTYLLDAGNEAGLELPFTCRGGICGTCSGRIVEGTVDQSDVSDLEFVLEPEQIEQGVALLCMARPLSDCVVETQCDWGYSLVTGEGWRGATGQKGKPNPIMGKKWDELDQSEGQS